MTQRCKRATGAAAIKIHDKIGQGNRWKCNQRQLSEQVVCLRALLPNSNENSKNKSKKKKNTEKLLDGNKKV